MTRKSYMYDHKLYLHTLVEFTATLLAPYEVETVLAELTDRVTDVLGLAGSGVSIVRDGRLEYIAGYGQEVAAVERAQEEAQVGPCITAFTTGSVVAVGELAAERSRWPEYCRVAATVDISSVASIPMRHGDGMLGVLDLYGRGRRDWPREDLRAASVMANIATGYVVHAREHAEHVEHIEQLQRALDSRVAIEQAKGALAARHGITPDQGFARLRKHARDHNVSLHDVARAVVEDGLTIEP